MQQGFEGENKRERVKMRDGGTAKEETGGTKCKGEEMRASEQQQHECGRDWMRLGASIKYFNHRLSCYENAFDLDSKGLLQNKHFFELAAAQWDSPRENVQKML